MKNNLGRPKDGQIDAIWPVIYTFLGIGIFSIFLYSTRFIWPERSFLKNGLEFFDVFGAGLLIAGAFATFGGIIGFLFGIPKVVQNTSLQPEDEKNNQSIIVHNDNLVQISDWLTKIIVGVGLTQLYSIPGFVKRIGNAIEPLFGDDNFARGVGISVGFYYLVLGFFATYIWTRIYFVRQLKNTDEAIRQQLKEKEIELESTRKDIELAKEDNALKTEDIDAILRTYAQPIKDYTKELVSDPQKGKWGGKAENNGRKVSATVRQSTTEEDWFNISVEVVSTDNLRPLTGKVFFHLHPTMPIHEMESEAKDNKAQLNIFAWGAFTIGIECDDKRTQLEIDLSELADAPLVFKSR